MIGESGGLGTVATRADIIEKLFSTFLLEKRGKDIITTAKGRQLLELVPNELKEPALTARWEQKLSAISNGNLNSEAFITEIKTYAKMLVSQIKDSDAKFRHDNMTHKKCPDCGKFLLEVNGKHGKMLVCQDRECGYRKSIAVLTNARCPNCHKKMELRGEGDAKSFFCKCGYREKLAAFQKRREQNGSGKVSKGEVSRYMKSQSSEPVNTALADALAKLNLK
jgi:DNA topoisomerase III